MGGPLTQLTVTNSYFHDALGGHEIKSHAANTIIMDSRIQDGPTAATSYSVDLAVGGVATIENNVIEKGPNAQNDAFIHYGGDVPTVAPNSSLTISGNTVIDDKASNQGPFVYDQAVFTDGGPIVVPTISGNTFYGPGPDNLLAGPNFFDVQSGAPYASINTFLPNYPTALAIKPLSASLAEGNSGSTPFTFTVTRSGDDDGGEQRALGGDRQRRRARPTRPTSPAVCCPRALSASPPAQASKTITVNVAGDTTVEPNEQLHRHAVGPDRRRRSRTASATGTILNDDASRARDQPLQRIEAEGNSGSTPFTFTVTRSGDDDGGEQRALGGDRQRRRPANAADFTGGVLPSGTVSFAAGADQQDHHRQRRRRHHGGSRTSTSRSRCRRRPARRSPRHRADRHHPQRRRHRAGDQAAERIVGGGQQRQHAVHLHRHPLGR